MGRKPPKGLTRAPTERVSPAFKGLGLLEKQELRRGYKHFRVAVAAHATDHAGFVLTYKAVAHALLYLAQFHGVPPAELTAYLRQLISAYLPHGTQLGMSDDLKRRLETGAGFPQWPNPQDRAAINAALTSIYHSMATLPVAYQISLLWHALMANAERLGMTHEAVLLRLEVLDRLTREEGAPSRYIPDRPPKWHQAAT